MHQEASFMDQRAAARIEQKSAQEAIISRIGADLRLTPFLARAYYDQMADYFRLYSGQELQDNELSYCAVAAEEPAGKSLRECLRVSVRLTLHDPSDSQDGSSLSALRQKRIVRLSQEALDQGGLLTQEDLAVLLTTSCSTIKRDLRALRSQGISVPTRGQQRDIGPGISHKVQTIERYLAGEDLTHISRSMNHGLESMERYLRAFRQVALMTREGLSPDFIRKASRLSLNLIAQYQALYEQACDDQAMQARLNDLLSLHRLPAAKGGQS
jgi:biotin operon repressor